MRNPEGIKFTDRLVKMLNLKSQVAQTCCFRMCQPRRWGGEREKFYDIVIAKSLDAT